MANINLTLEGLDTLQQMQAFLHPNTFDKAQRGGISYAAKAVAPAVSKGIGAAYNIKAARIKQDISSVRIDKGGTEATIRFSRRPPTLSQYNVKPGTRGKQPGLGRGQGWGAPQPAGKPLTAIQLRSTGRTAIKGAFQTTGNNSNQLVFRRGSNGRLISLYGPSIGSIFLGNSEIGTRLRADVQTRIQNQYITGFQRVLDSAARGYGSKR
jgi:hypothetical protein